ncbi:MAG: VWA domain-containing protein [Succinivibrio sp.]
MLRLFRCHANEVCPTVNDYISIASVFEKEIEQSLGFDLSVLIASPQRDGEYINFYTQRKGEITEVTKDTESIYSSKLKTLDEQRKRLYDYVKNTRPFIYPELEPHRDTLKKVVSGAEKVFLLQKNVPVLVPLKLDYKPEFLLTNKEAVLVSKKSGCLLPFILLLLLLLLLLGLLWWFLIKPWPFEGGFYDRINELLNRNTPDLVAQEGKELTDKEPKEEVQEIAVQEPSDAVIQEPSAEDEDQSRAERERLEKEEAERIAKEKAELEAKKKAEAERLAKEKALKEAKEKAKKEALAKEQQKQKIPKCRELKEQGKMPKIAIAFDGSESMTLNYGRESRLKAAQEAAKQFVNSVDKNVSIGLVEINGCDVSKPYGFFSGTQRQALISTIYRINPYRYDGKTPLYDGLYKLANMLDGVNSEDIGILISDGEDTCYGRNGFFNTRPDICQVAMSIHKRKPKLKIHTILIGDDIDSARCVATITGGKVFKPRDASQIIEDIEKVGATVKKVCEE